MLPIRELILRAVDATPENYPWGQITWLVSGELDPEAQMTVGMCRVNPGRSNQLHYHPNCDEVLLVISGRCRKFIGDESSELGPGDVVRIPKGELHRAEAISAEPMVCVITYDTPHREVFFVDELGR